MILYILASWPINDLIDGESEVGHEAVSINIRPLSTTHYGPTIPLALNTTKEPYTAGS